MSKIEKKKEYKLITDGKSGDQHVLPTSFDLCFEVTQGLAEVKVQAVTTVADKLPLFQEADLSLSIKGPSLMNFVYECQDSPSVEFSLTITPQHFGAVEYVTTLQCFESFIPDTPESSSYFGFFMITWVILLAVYAYYRKTQGEHGWGLLPCGHWCKKGLVAAQHRWFRPVRELPDRELPDLDLDDSASMNKPSSYGTL